MSGGGISNREPVKVVVINTQYVETDAINFKSVVQRLTGKDAIVEVNLPPPLLPAASHGGQTAHIKVDDGGKSITMSREGVSFKDIDRFLMMELPSLDELYRLCKE